VTAAKTAAALATRGRWLRLSSVAYAFEARNATPIRHSPGLLIAFDRQLCKSPGMCLRRATVTLLLAASALLCACADSEETVRQARIAPDESVTVEQALTRYPYFKAVTWCAYDDAKGRHIVEAACDIDVAANCQGISGNALKLARRDVARDYFLARFVVEGFPRKVRALEARHITQCASGTNLGMADPKYLRAIYNRERVRFFCLEGANCPGQRAENQPGPETPAEAPGLTSGQTSSGAGAQQSAP